MELPLNIRSRAMQSDPAVDDAVDGPVDVDFLWHFLLSSKN